MSKEVGAGGRFDIFLDSVYTHIILTSTCNDFEMFGSPYCLLIIGLPQPLTTLPIYAFLAKFQPPSLLYPPIISVLKSTRSVNHIPLFQ